MIWSPDKEPTATAQKAPWPLLQTEVAVGRFVGNQVLASVPRAAGLSGALNL